MLQISFHQSFKGGPALLLAGAHGDLVDLESVFKDWDGRKIDLIEKLKLDKDEGLDKLFLEITDGSGDSVMRIVGNECFWSMRSLSKRRILGLIDGLMMQNEPGHQYLDSGSNPIRIICSKDEY